MDGLHWTWQCPIDRARLDSVVNLRFVVERKTILAGLDNVSLVTDDNMLTEWYPRPERWQ